MAVYNEILIGRWNRFLQKLTGMKGGPPARQLSSEISVSQPIFHGPENRYLEGWERFGFVITQNLLAAQTSDIRFRNPVGSNVIAVAESINITATAAQTGFIEIGAVTTDLATLVPLTVGALDSRSRPQPTLIGSKTNNGAFFGAAVKTWGIGTTSQAIELILTENQEFTILPGMGLQIDSQTVNVTLQASMIWRERFLEDSERF